MFEDGYLDGLNRGDGMTNMQIALRIQDLAGDINTFMTEEGFDAKTANAVVHSAGQIKGLSDRINL